MTSTGLHLHTRCGHKGRDRIVGGNLTADGEVPWQCSLLNGNNQWTGWVEVASSPAGVGPSSSPARPPSCSRRPTAWGAPSPDSRYQACMVLARGNSPFAWAQSSL